MNLSTFVRAAAFCLLASAGSASATHAHGVGIKFGPAFANFSSEALDFKTRTGVHGGIFFGGNRDGVLGVQTEVNWLRKNVERVGGPNIRIDYLQVPVLLRLNAGSGSTSGFVAYGIVGPAIELKMATRSTV